MKRIICINWLICCCLVTVAVTSENNNETNIQNVKREIEFNEKRNENEEVRIVNAAAMNILVNGITAVGSSVCSIDLKLMINGLKTRMPWAISSKKIFFNDFVFYFFLQFFFYENMFFVE